MAGVAIGSLFMFSCSHEEHMHEVSLSEHNVVITLRAESFADQAATRAISAFNTETVDLGGGLLADVSLETDSEAETRAPLPLNEGTYSIYAADSHGNRIGGSRKLITGVVKDGKFKRTLGDLTLASGSYTLVCYNDNVTDDGTALSVANGKNAMIGVLKNVSVGGSDQSFAFEMKHHTARVRVKVMSYTPNGEGIKAVMKLDGDAPSKNVYDASVSQSTAIKAAFAFDKCALAGNASDVPSSIVSFSYTTDYQYVLPKVKGENITLEFEEGTMYGESLAGKSVTLSGVGELVQNGSYTVVVRLRKFPLYLYNDGTVGILADKKINNRTPVGIVIQEKKVLADKGKAVALKDATDEEVRKDINNKESYWEVFHADQNTINAAFNKKDGYEETWDASTSVSNVVKANDPQKKSAYYYAGHYGEKLATEGVTGAMTTAKWYLPAVGEWNEAIKKLSGVQIAKNFFEQGGFDYNGKAPTANWNKPDDLQKLFTNAEGNLFDNTNPSNGFKQFWCSTDMGSDANYGFTLYLKWEDKAIAFGWNSSGGYSHYVRAFVHF